VVGTISSEGFSSFFLQLLEFQVQWSILLNSGRFSTCRKTGAQLKSFQVAYKAQSMRLSVPMSIKAAGQSASLGCVYIAARQKASGYLLLILLPSGE